MWSDQESRTEAEYEKYLKTNKIWFRIQIYGAIPMLLVIIATIIYFLKIKQT